MANLSGKLLRVADPTAGTPSESGSIIISLCGYGSQTPAAGGGTIVRLSYEIDPSNPSDTTWAAVVPGNDVIRPAGTYYTLTYRDSNGDIAQTQAYIFADSGSYDMDFATPFDPSLGPPPSPIPPALLNLLEVVAYSATPVFSGAAYPSWEITLTGNASPTFSGLVDGNLYTIIVIQDGTGGHAFNWPANVHNATPINPSPNGITFQTFVAVSGALYPIGAGTYA